ncbi:MAG: elongation factor P [Patescibacteria group bacterium]|jgi:elongation factor P
MLNFNEIKTGRVIKVNNEPYIIIKTDHHKMGRGGAVLKVKCRNLLNNNVLERTYQGAEKAEEAETETKKANFMYKDKEQAYFMDNKNFEQFDLPLSDLGDSAQFLKDGTDVDVLYFEGRPMSISLPIKMEFKVTSAPPGVKGNSAGNVNKQVEIETGAKINVPMFIDEGDMIRINTDTGEYVERVN